MADPIVAKYMNKFMDEAGNPVDEEGGCIVEFYLEAALDYLLTEGGEIEKRHPKVKEIQKREAEALAAMQQERPFLEEAPLPAGAEPAAPRSDATDAVRKAFAKEHAAWDMAKRERTAWEERRAVHEADLKERTRTLVEHDRHPELYKVLPAGRPIYTDREYVRKRIPGDKDQIVERPIREGDKREYPEKYRRFKSGEAQAISGTPLEKWPAVMKSQVLDLKYYGISTVEQLAQVSDENLSKIGPYTSLRQKAKDWLDVARGAAPMEAMRAELNRRDNDIETLKQALQQQGAALKEIQLKQQAR